MTAFWFSCRGPFNPAGKWTPVLSSRWSGGYTVKFLSWSDKWLMQETILKNGRQYPSHPVIKANWILRGEEGLFLLLLFKPNIFSWFARSYMKQFPNSFKTLFDTLSNFQYKKMFYILIQLLWLLLPRIVPIAFWISQFVKKLPSTAVKRPKFDNGP